MWRFFYMLLHAVAIDFDGALQKQILMGPYVKGLSDCSLDCKNQDRHKNPRCWYGKQTSNRCSGLGWKASAASEGRGCGFLCSFSMWKEKLRNLQLKITWKRCSKKLIWENKFKAQKFKQVQWCDPVTERVPVGQYIQTCGSCYKVHQSVYVYIW